jgi:hypothetical protein
MKPRDVISVFQNTSTWIWDEDEVVGYLMPLLDEEGRSNAEKRDIIRGCIKLTRVSTYWLRRISDMGILAGEEIQKVLFRILEKRREHRRISYGNQLHRPINLVLWYRDWTGKPTLRSPNPKAFRCRKDFHPFEATNGIEDEILSNGAVFDYFIPVPCTISRIYLQYSCHYPISSEVTIKTLVSPDFTNAEPYLQSTERYPMTILKESHVWEVVYQTPVVSSGIRVTFPSGSIGINPEGLSFFGTPLEKPTVRLDI